MRRLLLMCALAAALPAACARNLTVNETLASAKTIVYDLPDPDGREDAIRYITSVRDRLLPGIEIVDARALPDAGLRERLQSPFILYTTLDANSKLLGPATAPLGWELARGRLRWDDFAANAAGLRIALVGRNPYGSGNSVVYAAGSNRLVAQANDVFQGPASYFIYDGAELVREGMYDEKFAMPKARIGRAEASADVEQLLSTFDRVHPDLPAKLGRTKFAGLRRQLTGSLDRMAGPDGNIDLEDLARELLLAAASFGDGHTGVQWNPARWRAAGRRFPAFRLTYDNGSFLIGAAKDTTLAGAELIAVNGVPVRDFLRPILDRCSGETLAFKAVRFLGNQRLWFYLTNLFGGSPTYTLKLRDRAGHEREAPLETVDLGAFHSFEAALGGNRPAGARGTRVEFPDDGAAALFTYPSFNLSDAEKKKVDEIFHQIQERHSTDLVIDLRGNGGGNSAMGDYIFHYIHEGKFVQYSKVRMKVSPEILPMLGSWGAHVAGRMGQVIDDSGDPRSFPKPDSFFSGRVYLLVDNGTFSSAADFAAMFRDYQTGKIVGSETGGLAVCFGDVYGFALKNSGIRAGVSWKQFFGPKPRPGDDEHGVLPDVPLRRNALAAFESEKDPVLAYTLRYIRDSRVPPR